MSAAPERPLAVNLASVVAVPVGSSIVASICSAPAPMPPLRTPVPLTRACSLPAASCGSVVTSASIAPARSVPKSAPTSCNRATFKRALPDVRSRVIARSATASTALAQWPSKLGTTMPPAASRSKRPASDKGWPATSPFAVRLPPAEPSGRNSMVEDTVVVPASPGYRTESRCSSTRRSNLPVWPLPLPDRPNAAASLATRTSDSDQVCVAAQGGLARQRHLARDKVGWHVGRAGIGKRALPADRQAFAIAPRRQVEMGASHELALGQRRERRQAGQLDRRLDLADVGPGQVRAAAARHRSHGRGRVQRIERQAAVALHAERGVERGAAEAGQTTVERGDREIVGAAAQRHRAFGLLRQVAEYGVRGETQATPVDASEERRERARRVGLDRRRAVEPIGQAIVAARGGEAERPGRKRRAAQDRRLVIHRRLGGERDRPGIGQFLPASLRGAPKPRSPRRSAANARCPWPQRHRPRTR